MTVLNKRALYILLALETAMVAAFWFDALYGLPAAQLSRLFNLNLELTFPAWFSSLQLAFLAAVIFVLRFRLSESGRGQFRGLFLLGCVAIFFSADEMLALHERLNLWLITDPEFPTFRYNNGAWLMLYIPFFGLLGLACTYDLQRLYSFYPASTRLFVLGLCLALTGAIVLEVAAYQLWFDVQEGLAYTLEVGLEEWLEMSGVSCMLIATVNAWVD